MPQFTSPRPMTLNLRKPRNPLVAAAQFRQAGRHEAARHAQRQQAQQELRRQLRDLPPDHSP